MTDLSHDNQNSSTAVSPSECRNGGPMRDALAACCLLKLNRASEVEGLLTKRTDGESTGYAKYYMGITFAHQGRIADAIRCFIECIEYPHLKETAGEAMRALAKREVERKIAMKDYEGASAVLSQALEVAPDDPVLRPYLSKLGNFLPGAYLKANRRADAADVWEDILKRDPSDPGASHSLGLLYYWWAEKLESEGQTKDADIAWRGAIRSMVLVSFNERYWSGLKEDRENVYSPINDKDLEKVRRKHTDNLTRRLQYFQDDHLANQREDDAKRLSRLSSELAVELKTADALSGVIGLIGEQKKKLSVPPICGPAMLEHLGYMVQAQKTLAVAERILRDEECTDELHWCLSTWALPWILLQEHRYIDAIELLKVEISRKPSSEDGNNLLARAYLGRSRQLSASGEIDEAVTFWSTAYDHARDENLKVQIRDEAEKTTADYATKFRKENTRESVNKAIKLLRNVRGFSDSERVRENLSAMYMALALIEGNDEGQDKNKRMKIARKHLDEALRIFPNNVNAKRNKAGLILDEAIELLENGHMQSAVKIARKAYNMCSSDRNICKTVSLIIGGYGVNRYNNSQTTQGISLLQEAIKIDPTNEQARDNLRRIFLM